MTVLVEVKHSAEMLYTDDFWPFGCINGLYISGSAAVKE